MRSTRAFTLVEILGVLVILIVLTTGAIVGLKRQRENAHLDKLLLCLSAVDQAKQSWVLFHPGDAWPTDEPSRWSAISKYLNSSAFPISPTSSGYNSYNGFFPSTNFQVQIGEASAPSQAVYSENGSSVAVNRPL